MEDTRLYIGCSGFYYPQWRKTLYNDAPPARWLEEYCKTFNSVELNVTFYRIPQLKTLKGQAARTPADFKFAVKVNRYFTHILRLKNCRQQINSFIHLVEEGLEEKLEKVLFQLPPSFRYSPGNLEAVAESIPDSESNVVEFRHASWWNDEVVAYFKKHRPVFCSIDFPGLQPPFIVTGKSFYLRMHGVPQLFKSPYRRRRLKEIAEKIPDDRSSCWIFFNNTYHDHAHRNAITLREMLQQKWGINSPIPESYA